MFEQVIVDPSDAENHLVAQGGKKISNWLCHKHFFVEIKAGVEIITAI
jgi:hypothetical protein